MSKKPTNPPPGAYLFLALLCIAALLGVLFATVFVVRAAWTLGGF